MKQANALISYLWLHGPVNKKTGINKGASFPTDISTVFYHKSIFVGICGWPLGQCSSVGSAAHGAQAGWEHELCSCAAPVQPLGLHFQPLFITNA